MQREELVAAINSCFLFVLSTIRVQECDEINEDDKDAIGLSFTVGSRKSTLLHMPWADVDLKAGFIIERYGLGLIRRINALSTRGATRHNICNAKFGSQLEPDRQESCASESGRQRHTRTTTLPRACPRSI